MKKIMFTSVGFAVATAFWFFDASVHYFIYREPQFEFIPSGVNELWMRIVIILFIVFFGIFADFYSRKMLHAQKQFEAFRIYRSMTYATHHILNNLLNQMQLFRMEALRSKDFDQEIIGLYDEAIREASGLVNRLSQVDKITEENIWASVSPKNKIPMV